MPENDNTERTGLIRDWLAVEGDLDDFLFFQEESFESEK